MKLYKLSKELYAEPSLQDDAECVIGRRIHNLSHGNEGYITKSLDNEELGWMPKSEFDKQAIIVDSSIDQMRAMLLDIDKAIKFLYAVSKKDGGVLKGKRNKAYMAIRRLKALKMDIEHIINLELLDL